LYSAVSYPFVLLTFDVTCPSVFHLMMEYHTHNLALAPLAVQDRPTSRPLTFDKDLRLRERGTGLAFSGIHVISPQLLPKLTEDGAFSIIDSYLRLASQDERILGFRTDQYFWRDVGRLADLKQIENNLPFI